MAPRKAQVDGDMADDISEEEVVEPKKEVKFKIEKIPTELPLGLFDKETKRWYRGFEIGKMTSDLLVSFEDEVNPFRAFGAIVAKGLNRVFDPETGEDAPNWRGRSSKLFFADVFFLMVEIIIKTKGTSLVPSVYQCPQCKKFTKFENPVGESGAVNQEEGFDLTSGAEEYSSLEMEDIRSLPLNLERGLETPEIYFHFDEGVSIDGERFTEFVFRIPEIGDYIMASSGSAGKAVEKKVLFHCLVSVNGAKGKDLEVLKARYGMGLLNLDLNDYLKIVKRIDTIGYAYIDHAVKCAHCGYEFKTVFDLSNFFVSVLRR